MVSEIAWLQGGSALALLIFSSTFGIISMINGKKRDAKLLFYAGFMMLFVGLLYLGPVTDFISILLFQQNIDNSFGLYGLLSYVWVGPAIIVGMSIGAEMITPEKSKEIVLSFAVLGVIFELFLILDTMASFTFIDPNTPPVDPNVIWIAGKDIIDSSFVSMSPAYLFILGFLVCILIFNGIGFLIKGLKSTGIVKKKILLLSAGFIIFVIAGAMDALISPGITLAFVRMGMMVSTVCLYLGLRT